MDDSDLEIIKRLLEKKLTAEDNDELDKSPEIKDEVEVYQEIDLALESIGMDDLRSDMQGWETAAQKKGRVIPTRRFWAIAASAAVLLAISFFIFKPTSSNPDDLFAANYRPYEDMITSRAGSDPILTKGMDAYNNKDYHQAIDLLSQHLNADDARIEGQLYLGIAQLSLGRTADAIQNFSDIHDHELIGQQATWYLALTYLKAGQDAEAQAVLQSIASDNNHYKKEQASRILKHGR